MTVSTYLNGEYGQKDLYIGVPTIINRKGAREVLELQLEGAEKKRFEIVVNITFYERRNRQSNKIKFYVI